MNEPSDSSGIGGAEGGVERSGGSRSTLSACPLERMRASREIICAIPHDVDDVSWEDDVLNARSASSDSSTSEARTVLLCGSLDCRMRAYVAAWLAMFS